MRENFSGMRSALFVLGSISWVNAQEVAQEGEAMEAQVDELDAGDQWVDASEDVDWYSAAGQLLVDDPGAFKLDVSAGHRSSSWLSQALTSADDTQGTTSFGNELYAMATLQVPFEGFLHRRAKTLPRARADTHFAPTRSEEEPENKRPEDAKESTPPSPSAPSSTERENPSAVSTDDHNGSSSSRAPAARETAGTRDESVGDGLSSALILLVIREIQGRVGGPEASADRRISSLVRRSRLSGLSPELRLRGVLGFDRTTSTEDAVGIYPGDTTTRGARDSLAEVRLTFRLDRLVFGDGEDSLERQRISLMGDRRKLVREAIDLFMDFRLARARAKDESLPPDDRLKAQIEAEARLAELHFLTNGWFEGERTLRRLAVDVPETTRVK